MTKTTFTWRNLHKTLLHDGPLYLPFSHYDLFTCLQSARNGPKHSVTELANGHSTPSSHSIIFFTLSSVNRSNNSFQTIFSQRHQKNKMAKGNKSGVTPSPYSHQKRKKIFFFSRTLANSKTFYSRHVLCTGSW